MIKTYSKENGKEPIFKRSDREEMIILGRFAKKNMDHKGTINWEHFNEKDFNTLREEAPKEDLRKVLKELGIDNIEVVNSLKAKSVLTPAHFVQKPKSWFSKLEIISSTLKVDSDVEQNEQQPNRLLLNGTDKFEIERFKQWYTSHMVGCLPPDWVVSFRNDDMQPRERYLRKVLRTIGLSADVIDALKMNNILDVRALNEHSKYWRTSSKSGDEQEDTSYSWQQMGLTRYEAKNIIEFRHWYNFYVAGKPDVTGWSSGFNLRQYLNFLQCYQPGDSFRMLSWWKFWQKCKFWQPDSLRFPQERYDYYDMIQKAVDSGDVSNEQRYHLRKYYEERREKMSLMEEITINHYEGLGDTSQQEERLHEMLREDDRRADEQNEEKLLFSQQFYQFYFSATLVLTLLYFWYGTTIWFMIQYLRESRAIANAMEDGRQLEESLSPSLSFSPSEERPGYEYVAFVHNVLFGLVSAVVIQELGEESTKKRGLYYRFLPTYREKRKRQKEYQIRRNLETTQDCKSKSRRLVGYIFYLLDTWFVSIILISTASYIIIWIILGCVSLAFAAINGLDTNNPLYTTGQAWLGIAVTIGYTYFGLNSQSTSTTSTDDVDAATANDPTDRRGDGGREDNTSHSQDSDHNIERDRN